jgi:hypothetical protein
MWAQMMAGPRKVKPAHDTGIPQQPLDVALAEARDPLGIEERGLAVWHVNRRVGLAGDQ